MKASYGHANNGSHVTGPWLHMHCRHSMLIRHLPTPPLAVFASLSHSLSLSQAASGGFASCSVAAFVSESAAQGIKQALLGFALR